MKKDEKHQLFGIIPIDYNIYRWVVTFTESCLQDEETGRNFSPV